MKNLKTKNISQKSAKTSQRLINLEQSRQEVELLNRDFAKRVRYFILILFGVALAGYLAWQLFQIVKPPELVVTEPAAEAVVETSQITIRGYVEPEAELTINQEVVLPCARIRSLYPGG